MARPKGFRLSRTALQDLLDAKGILMTEAASVSGVPLTTLSGLAQGGRGASIKTARRLAEGIACSAETLFPELAGFERPQITDPTAATVDVRQSSVAGGARVRPAPPATGAAKAGAST
jgi:transcriptional regulator with XRE-family HTH domain